MATKAVATTPEKATATDLAEYRDYDGEWEDDGSEDIGTVLPVVKLVQSTSQMKDSSRNGGYFWRSDTEDFYPNIDIVPLLMRETRALFEEGKEQPGCMSPGGRKPRPNMPYWAERNQEQPETCGECPFSEWGADGTPPPCKNSYMVAAVWLDDLDAVPTGKEDIVQIRIAGKSIRPWKQLVAKAIHSKKLPLFAFKLRLMSEEFTAAGKKAHVLTFEHSLLPKSVAQVLNVRLREERSRMEAAADQAVQVDDDAPARNRSGDGWNTEEQMDRAAAQASAQAPMPDLD